MRDKNIPLYRSLISLFFIIWGIVWVFISQDILGKAISSSFVIFGIIFFLYSLNEVLRYRKTGKVKTRIDERVELNSLKASRRSFEFLYISIAILIVLLGVELINETIFASLMGPILAIGIAIYILTYSLYEKMG
jgi:uncharacterized membrane protein